MKLAEMEVKLQSARLLTWKAAMLKDAGENFIKVLCMCTVDLSQSSHKQPSWKFEKVVVTGAGRLQEFAFVSDPMVKQ